MITIKLKAMALSLTVAAMLLLPTTSSAQTDGFFRNYDNGNRGDGDITSDNITNADFGESAPIGSGIAILIGAGLGYAVLKKKED